MKPGRAFLPFAMLLALALSGSALAQHQGGRGRGGQQQKQQQAQRPMMPPAQGTREANYRQVQPRQPGRMSDEERRQLRRDISDHGRDIYTDRQGQRQR